MLLSKPPARSRAAVDRRTFLAGTAALLATGPARAALPIPPDRRLEFRVMRSGEAIGSHRLTFEGPAETTEVRVEVEIAVRFGPIVLFRYRHHARERWQGDSLAGFDSETDDDGARLRVTATRTAAGFEVEGSTIGRYLAPSEALAATHWNKRMLRGPMINTQDGRLLRPVIACEGETPVPRSDHLRLEAQHYALSGDADLDLWYDQAAEWAGLQFKAKDGSAVTYERV